MLLVGAEYLSIYTEFWVWPVIEYAPCGEVSQFCTIKKYALHGRMKVSLKDRVCWGWADGLICKLSATKAQGLEFRFRAPYENGVWLHYYVCSPRVGGRRGQRDPCSLLVTQTSQSMNSGFRERPSSEDKAESDSGRYPCQPLEYTTQYNKNNQICCLLSYK